MRRPLKALVVALALLPSLVEKAGAVSSSVGLSITFEAPPLELIQPRGVSPLRHRACERLRDKIAALWVGRSRPPTLSCRSEARMPLVVELETIKGALIARP